MYFVVRKLFRCRHSRQIWILHLGVVSFVRVGYRPHSRNAYRWRRIISRKIKSLIVISAVTMPWNMKVFLVRRRRRRCSYREQLGRRTQLMLIAGRWTHYFTHTRHIQSLRLYNNIDIVFPTNGSTCIARVKTIFVWFIGKKGKKNGWFTPDCLQPWTNNPRERWWKNVELSLFATINRKKPSSEFHPI